MTADYYDIIDFLLDSEHSLCGILTLTQWNVLCFKFSSLSTTVAGTENRSLKFLNTTPLSFF